MSFVQDRMSWHDMSQGPVQQTGNPLDVAIDGEGILVVQTANGERYTRNGALQLNTAGELVTSNGDKVLGDGGPIVLQTTDRDIVDQPRTAPSRCAKARASTRIRTRGKLRLVALRPTCSSCEGRPQHLRGAGGRDAERRREAERHSQGAIEKSNVEA